MSLENKNVIRLDIKLYYPASGSHEYLFVIRRCTFKEFVHWLVVEYVFVKSAFITFRSSADCERS